MSARTKAAPAPPADSRANGVPRPEEAQALVLRQPQASWAVPRSLAEAITIAEMAAKSNSFQQIRSTAQALLSILAGAEMGFGPFASLVDVHIIEGKPSVGAHLKAAAIKRSGRYDYRIVALNRAECSLEFSERKGDGWEALGRVSMTFAEAVESGLALASTGKGVQVGGQWIKTNWARTPDDMLFARCISKGYRRYTPDLTGGVLAYDPDELDPPREELPAPAGGEVIEAEPAPPAPAWRDDSDPQQALAEVLEGTPREQALAKREVARQERYGTRTDAPLTATEEQVEEIGELLKDLRFGHEKILAWLAKFGPGITSVRQLTVEQAAHALAKLAEAWAKREAQQATALA